MKIQIEMTQDEALKFTSFLDIQIAKLSYPLRKVDKHDLAERELLRKIYWQFVRKT